MNNLIDFKNFLNKEYNINAKIYKRKYKYIYNNTKNILYNIILLFLLLLFFIYLSIKSFISLKNIHFFKNTFDKVLFIIIVIIIIIYLLFLIFKFTLEIYNYYFLKKEISKLDLRKIKKYDDIQFETGDIIQCGFEWNMDSFIYQSTTPFLKTTFRSTFLVIKFKNIKYILHFSNKNSPYYKNINKYSIFIGNNIEIMLLDNFLYESFLIDRNYYRIFKIKTPIKIDQIIKYIEKINMNKINFSLLPLLSAYNEKTIIDRKTLNCSSFILNFLYYLKIIPFINYHNILPNDYIFLPNLSNNYYSEAIYFKF